MTHIRLAKNMKLHYLSPTINQVRLASLATLSIERKATEGANFDDVIKYFASMKARKKNS